MDLKDTEQKMHEKYPGEYAGDNDMQRILEKIEGMDPEVRNVLERILNNEEYEGIEIEGYTIEKLSDEYGMNEIAALLTLDWLKKEPENAKASLERGYDEVRL